MNLFWAAVRPIGELIFKWLILPVYRLAVISKLRIQRLALPARGFILFLVTNRYLFHVAVAAASIATIWMNVQTKQVLAQDIGKHSLLYSLMTQGESEIVTEQGSADGSVKYGSSRFSPGTIEAVPHIDFDYRTADELADQDLSFTIPGTVALAPMDHGGQETAGAVRPNRQSIEDYVVKDGDTLGSIARDFGVDVGTILWANNLSERQYIRPGDTLKILPVPGVLVKVAKGDTVASLASRYSGDMDEIMRQNNLTDSGLKVGMSLIIPNGEPPAIEQVRTIALSRNAYEDTHARLTEPGQSPGSAAQNMPAASNPVPKPSDAQESSNQPRARLLWPTTGHVITQYFSWRHTGLDIDGDFTSPLYAAEDGVVEIAGWNTGGYGLMVLIDHPNGMKTRYGHSSKLFVKTGDTVHRGQVIAMMGSTGRSTGSHLHFEVYVDGKRVNPLLYIR